MINPDFLRTFAQLAETRHFTQTARRLGMTQPGVSQHLKKLEEHFGVKLIERITGELGLTEAGRVLRDYAREVVENESRLMERIGRDEADVGYSRMCVAGSFAMLVYDVLIAYGRSRPRMRIDLTVAPSVDVEPRLLRDEIELGYSYRKALDLRIQSDYLFSEPICVIAPQGARPKTFADWQRLGFVHHPDGPNGLARVFSENFKEFRGQEDFPIRTSINQINRIVDPIEAGLGFSVLPAIAARHYAKGRGVRIVPMKKQVANRIYRLAWKGRKLPLRLTAIENEIKKALKSQRMLSS